MFEKTEFTNMCMIQHGNKVVAMDRKSDDWFGIKYPGDHVELGESFID